METIPKSSGALIGPHDVTEQRLRELIQQKKNEIKAFKAQTN